MLLVYLDFVCKLLNDMSDIHQQQPAAVTTMSTRL